jgi:hypothetical protein
MNDGGGGEGFGGEDGVVNRTVIDGLCDPSASKTSLLPEKSV